MTESAFSSSAQEIIQKPLDIEEEDTHTQLSAEQFNDYYELGWTANEIIAKNYTRVSMLSSLLKWTTMIRTLPLRLPSNFQTNFFEIQSQFIIT